MSQSPTIACPNCGKQYKWKPGLAGRKTQCTGCGQKMRLPAEARGAVEPIGELLKDQGHESRGAYELDVPDDHDDQHLEPGAGRSGGQPTAPGPPPAKRDRCPACNSKLKPGAVICINCGFNLAEGRKIQTAVSNDVVVVEEGDAGSGAASAAVAAVPNLGAYAKAAQRVMLDNEALAVDVEREQRRRDVTIPLILIVTGFAGMLLNALALHPFVFRILAQRQFDYEVKVAQAWGTAPPTAPAQMTALDMALPLILHAVTLVIQVPLLFVAILLVSKVFGTSFGKLGSVVLKMLALAVFVNMSTAVVRSLLDIATGGLGGLMGFIPLGANFLVFFTLAMWLYELETMETIVMWFIVFLLPWIVLFLVVVVMLGMFM